MTRRRILAAGTACLATIALAGGAVAQEAAPNPSPADLLKRGDPGAMTVAFKAICADHPGDPDAQVAVATAAPWNFSRSSKGKGAKGIYSALLAELAIEDVGNKLACALTSVVDGKDATLAAMTATAQRELSLGEPETKGDTAKWTASPTLVYLKVTQGKPFMIATLGLFTARAGK